MSIFQTRYEAHQKRKREVLAQLMAERHSNRVFDDQNVPGEVLAKLIDIEKLCPSSCDRRAIFHQIIRARETKELLGGLLVGGVGWVHRAPVIILLFAAREAYMAPGELQYMPYLDAGVVIANLYLAATAAGLHCCYINPNVRQENKEFFRARFGDQIFCGAFAVGWPKTK